MSRCVVVAGTDTGVGKTVFSAGLADALGGAYWKPIQSGLVDGTDSETVAALGRLKSHRIFPEKWRLRTPISPHLAAQIDGIVIELEQVTPPETSLPLVIEGAGGLLVPLNFRQTFADLIATWSHPVVLCSRTSLGTINHTLLSLEAMRRRSIRVLGVVFIGAVDAGVARTISEIGSVSILGNLPPLDPLTPDALRKAFADNFDPSEFRAD
ncbi:dethiobiotin synthase [Bradyrhizobium canariense]|uniref:ATP-dependent dethiobiotin synthetase BioD n=1 Tax=Bradyrhizobium canariense TaxID=255045 RepID=A0ABX3XB51_9BRAD|nr:dethiobiotin synthase [Bradyrhizobium canariense]OSJ19768.1 dethiobiotin synthase [Bradyrhizobium canariense]OSJ35924.1 dethiobiotin synthase [Bradyrhizobium canariense]